MLVSLKKFLNNEDGATAIEYGLIAALIGVAIIASLEPLSQALNGTFTGVATELNDAAAP
ncbi:MAG TPA: Flp family type IVb pilin [Terricaulis sp.]|nr:Flp family type IVb pilin [Terricaulis sp.]HRP10100.1 Flp family type IVb pilin [Terricaulis sp.]